MKKIILFLFLINQFVFAQKIKKDSTKVTELQEVFVTANRTATKRKETPVSIVKLTAKTINEAKAVALYELVNKVPGVLMVNLGNEQHSMSIRQPMTTNSYFLYLEDGLPIRPMGIFNHNALLEINQFNLENIEVVKGPVSSLYGPEAVGGAINLISKKPSVNPEFQVGIQADQWGYKRLQTVGGATIGKIGFQISGISSLQEKGWMTFSDYKKNNFNARIDYTISKNTRLISNTMWGKYYSDMSGTVNEKAYNERTYISTSDFTYRKSDALRTRLALEHDWNANNASALTAYHRDNKMGQNPSYGIRWNPTKNPETATGEVNSNDFKSYGITGQHTVKINNRDFNLSLITGGLYDYSPASYWSHRIDLKAFLNPGEAGKQTVEHYEITAVRPDIRIANYNADLYNTAGYTQLKMNLLKDKIILTMGGRYDNMKLDYTNNLDKATGTKIFERFTYKSGLNINPIKQAGLYYNYSEGFAPPGLTAIFRTKPNTGGTTGKPADFYYNLESALFENNEIGGWFNFFNGKLMIDYAFYEMKGKNELLNIRMPDNSTDYQSAGKTLHRGVELGIQFKPSEQLVFRTGGTIAKHQFINFEISTNPTDLVKNLDGKEMPQSPRWTGNTELTYYPKWLPKFRTGIEWQTSGDYYQDQINTLKYAGYDVFNFRVGYTWKSLEFYGNVLNLTDKLYSYNVSKGNATSAQSSYTPSAPRTFLVGLQYHFSLSK